MAKSFAALLTFPDWSCFSTSETSKLMSLSNTSFDTLQISGYTSSLLGFFWGGGPQLLSSSEHWSISDWEALIKKSVRYSLSFSPRHLPGRLFVEMNFSNVLPNLKMAFSIAFNLVSKFASCPVAATNIVGAWFMLTIPDAEEVAVVVIVEGGEVRVTKIFLLAVEESLPDYS